MYQLLLVALAQQMRIELVHIAQLLTANVALPRIALAVAALVQEVQRLIGELNAAEQTLQHATPCGAAQRHFGVRTRRCDRSVRCGRRRRRRRGAGGVGGGSGRGSSGHRRHDRGQLVGAAGIVVGRSIIVAADGRVRHRCDCGIGVIAAAAEMLLLMLGGLVM